MPQYPSKPRFDVTINYVCDGQLCNNVVHYRGPQIPPTFAQMQTAADALSTRLGAKYKAALTFKARYEGIELRYVNAVNPRYAVSTVNFGVGTYVQSTADTELAGLPSECAAVIRKIGEGPARRASGTMYFSGIPEDGTIESRIVSPYLEIVQSLANELKTIMHASFPESEPCVYSRTDNSLYSLVEVSVQTILGHQTRRRPRRF